MKRGAITVMKEIGGFFARLTSRKFLLTVFGLTAVTLYPESATAIVTLIATFVGAEGAADAVSRYSVEKTKQATGNYPALQIDDDDDDVDPNIILPGTPEPTAKPVSSFDAPL